MKGWVKLQGLRHPNVPATVCGMARCLRELGRRDEAFKLLSSVVRSRRHQEAERQIVISDVEVTVLAFEPLRYGGYWHSISNRVKLSYDQSIALCLWSMAIYIVEENPDEGGQIRALDLLHASADALRHGLEVGGSEYCSEMLAIIQNEERRLLDNGLSFREEREEYEEYFIEKFESGMGDDDGSSMVSSQLDGNCQQENVEMPEINSGVGIASLAAAAALNKQKHQTDTQDNK